jgi:hypothetical protein
VKHKVTRSALRKNEILRAPEGMHLRRELCAPSFGKAMARMAMALGGAVSCELLAAVLDFQKCIICGICEFSHLLAWQSHV